MAKPPTLLLRKLKDKGKKCDRSVCLKLLEEPALGGPPGGGGAGRSSGSKDLLRGGPWRSEWGWQWPAHCSACTCWWLGKGWACRDEWRPSQELCVSRRMPTGMDKGRGV